MPTFERRGELPSTAVPTLTGGAWLFNPAEPHAEPTVWLEARHVGTPWLRLCGEDAHLPAFVQLTVPMLPGELALDQFAAAGGLHILERVPPTWLNESGAAGDEPTNTALWRDRGSAAVGNHWRLAFTTFEAVHSLGTPMWVLWYGPEHPTPGSSDWPIPFWRFTASDRKSRFLPLRANTLVDGVLATDGGGTDPLTTPWDEFPDEITVAPYWP